jgi:hypothetical protein
MKRTVRFHEINTGGSGLTRYRMPGYRFGLQSCILIISRGINPFRVFGDVGRAHDV